MGDTYRSTRLFREDDDDDRGAVRSSTTVTRYKVGSSRNGDRLDRIEVEDDTRSRFSSGGRRVSNDLLDRPRSNFDPAERTRTVMETDREWDRRSRQDDVRVERRVDESFEDARGHDVERYRKETEYFAPAEPTPPPVIIRQQAPEPQKIIVQEAPSPQPYFYNRQERPEAGPMVLRERDVDREVVRRGPYEDDYYYRHERREFGPGPVGPYRGDPRDPYYRRDPYARDRDWGMARYDGRRREEYYSEDEDYYVSNGRRRRSRSRRHRSRSRSRSRSKSSDHHKLHLAEGALAGAGVTALLQSKRDGHGDLPENRGRKVLAGAALGALGTEALKRAHSAYEDRWGDRDESPNHHSRIKTGFGIAAVALAAAGAAKYFQANKVEKEEAHRGRSRTRGYTSDGYHDSRSRSRSSRAPSRRRSMSRIAKAALGTAATAGVLRHLHNRSKSRGGDGRSRSKSRLRTGAKIAGAAAAAGVAGKLYKNHQEKKERSRSRARSDTDDDRYYGRRDRSRSRSRSMARSLHSDAGADRELGLVEYGNGELPPPPDRRGYDSDDDRRSRRRRSRRRDRDSSSGSDDGRQRSQSRLRNMAAAGAAAFGIKEYKDKKDREKRERKSRERQPSRDEYDDGHGHRDRRDDRPSSPPHASGGAYYPPYPTTPGTAGPGDYHPYNNPAAAQSHDYQPYVPQDYMGYAPPPPPGPPPAPVPGPMAGYPPEPSGPPGPPGPPPSGPSGPTAGPSRPPEHVSYHTRDAGTAEPSEAVINTPSHDAAAKKQPAAAKSVTFIPMSPKSSHTMEMHRRQQEQALGADTSSQEDHGTAYDHDRRVARQRRSSDTTHDRPGGRSSRDTDSEEEVEDLPDRFDSQGRSLDGRSASHDGWTSRSGAFRREPQRSGDWDVRGAWHVGGTNNEAVERLAHGVTNALDGRGSWMQVIGEVLAGGALGGNPNGHEQQSRTADVNVETKLATLIDIAYFMTLPLDQSTASPETTLDPASAPCSGVERLAAREPDAPTASHGFTPSDDLTASHALAEAKAHQLGGGLGDAGGNPGADARVDTDAAFQPHILGMSKADVWIAIRRFNLLVFRVKATKERPLTDFDMGPTKQGETSPEQLQAHLARLYMTVVMGLFAFYKQMARLCSWTEPQRTSKFLSVYFAAWLVNLLAPTLFLFLIVMVLSPASRSLCFPHIPPSVVDAANGGMQKPPAGVMASETSVTGAPETHKGEAVEQEAHSFITSVSKLIMSITSDKNPDKGAPEDDPSPGIAKLSAKIANAKGKTDRDGQESNSDKTEEPMKHAIEDFDPQPLLNASFELIDTWERLGNLLSPVPLFPGDGSRRFLAACITVPTMMSLFCSRDAVVKSLELLLGFIIFGEPMIRRGRGFLDREFPTWRDYCKLRNTVLRGVSTNAQLAITMLRIGECVSAPLPPPPVSQDSAETKATANADSGPKLGVDAQPQESDKGDHDNSSQEGNDEHRSKDMERVVGFFKHGSKRAVNLFHRADTMRAKRGSTHAQARLDLGQTAREPPDAGPYRFPARYNGSPGYLHLTTTAATPSVTWQSHDGNLNSAWAVLINDIEDISKVDGMGFKTKHFVEWALDKESVMGLKLTVAGGACYHLDPVVKRDEVFNRLIAMGNQRWDVC